MWIWGSFYVTLSVPFTKEPGGTDKDGIEPLYFQLGLDFWAIFELKMIFGHFCVCLAWKFIWHFEMPFLYVFGIFDLFVFFLAWWCVWHFETPFLAISPFVGGEIANFCIAAKWSWMRCQYFSLSFQPDKIKLDEKPILFSFFSIGQDKAGYKANTFSYFQPDMIKVDEKPILVFLIFNRTWSIWMKSQY